MAAAEVIKRLSTRATAAEQMIQLLRKQVDGIRQSSGCAAGSANYAQEIQNLKRENNQLKEQVEQWKGKLISAEKSSGTQQITTSVPEAAEPHQAKSEGLSEQTKPEKKEKPKKEKKPAVASSNDGADAIVDVGRLDMRVGLIRTAKKHPDADSLYVEEVDVGEEKPRTVISGLVKFIPEDEMQNRKAIMLCNLKPAKMRGIMSEAMVMCASTPDKVEILSPPENSKPGDPVMVAGYERRPDVQLKPKQKIFEAVAPDLKVNTEMIATYKGVPWLVNGEPCKSQTLVDVIIK